MVICKKSITSILSKYFFFVYQNKHTETNSSENLDFLGYDTWKVGCETKKNHFALDWAVNISAISFSVKVFIRLPFK